MLAFLHDGLLLCTVLHDVKKENEVQQSYVAVPRRPSQGQMQMAAGPSPPRQLPARPPSGERRYSQPAESRPAARPGMGLEGGQQAGGPTAEQR